MKILVTFIIVFLFYSCSATKNNKKESFESVVTKFIETSSNDSLRIRLASSDELNDESILSDVASKRLIWLVDYLFDKETIELVIESHESDSEGAKELSFVRGNSIRTKIVFYKDFAQDRLRVVAFGDLELLDGYAPKSEKHKRVDVLLIRRK